MPATDDFMRSAANRGPAVYYGYCGRTGRYRMMDLPDYVSNVQQGMSRWITDASTMYQEMARGVSSPPGQTSQAGHRSMDRHCGCDDCHCECCICDTDVLVHARCDEVRRIPVTFENDTRRERTVKLELGDFVTEGGRDLGWEAKLSETEFTLRSCDEHTIVVTVKVGCKPAGSDDKPEPPGQSGKRAAIVVPPSRGTVDRCEVGYATLRAEGCLTRPIVLGVAVLPDDCDSYRRPCGCGCCH